MFSLPPVYSQVAYGTDGEPTKALTGFAAKNGVALEDCTKEADAKGVEYVWALTRQEGRHAAEVRLMRLLSAHAPEAPHALHLGAKLRLQRIRRIVPDT